MGIENRKIKEIVKDALNEAKTKDEIYYEIISNYKESKDKKKIADIIRFIPEKWRLKKYGIYNTIFLILLIIIEIKLLDIYSYAGFFWFAILTYFVARRLTKYYLTISVMGGIIIYAAIMVLINYYTKQNNDFLVKFGILIIIGLIFILFGIFMPKLLTPKYTFVEESVIDSNGSKRIKKRIKFN